MLNISTLGDEDNASVSSNPSSSYPPLNLLQQSASSQIETPLNLEVNPRSSNDSLKSSSAAAGAGDASSGNGRRSMPSGGHLEDMLTPSKRFCDEVTDEVHENLIHFYSWNMFVCSPPLMGRTFS